MNDAPPNASEASAARAASGDAARIAVDRALDRLGEIIQEERAALKRRDAKRVAELAADKEALASILETSTRAGLVFTRERLRSLSGDLRRNAILLACARDSLRDALDALDREGIRANRRLSVIG